MQQVWINLVGVGMAPPVFMKFVSNGIAHPGWAFGLHGLNYERAELLAKNLDTVGLRLGAVSALFYGLFNATALASSAKRGLQIVKKQSQEVDARQWQCVGAITELGLYFGCMLASIATKDWRPVVFGFGLVTVRALVTPKPHSVSA